ncbi:potassium-transporting ATPase subunit KdpA [Acidiphilium sp. C61]|jgi:K+-transporting ATPase ATPase A chain|uniref:potassium-transporting ATPase subunit KdpA n=1 Tax=Acidiphilium sp. C61 TaxID=1671485 RepID=UPI00157B2C5B|nr:potassium-transporting ATPase subunit KdpA [Acidiphilium sp. C61]
MTLHGLGFIALALALVFACAVSLGAWLARLYRGELRFLAAIEVPLYRLCGIDPARQMSWSAYAVGLLLLGLVHFLLLYAILRLQYFLPFNPEHITGMSPRLAFNTAISFATNTNWQAYAPESQMSYGAQMFGLAVHNFLSAAAGLAAAGALMRAFAGGGLRTLGNVHVDLVRITLYLLLPVAFIAAILLIASGVPMTLAPAAHVHALAGGVQTIARGPVALQEAIKEFGTNGGGFFNANAAHPFENPTAWTNLLEIWLILVIGFALPIALGHVAGRRRDGRALFVVMAVILACGMLGAYAAEAANNPILVHAGLAAHPGNMVGKEARFGIAQSTSFNIAATGTSTGAVNSVTDSYLPLGGLAALFMMQLGEIAPGGVGSGLYGIVLFALLAVFVAGLMVGRTPEYLGKKIEAREMKLAMLALLVQTLVILVGAGVSLSSASGLASLANAGPHGLTEMLYGWTSATENNGSALAGLSANTTLLDYGLGIAMLLGRFAVMIPVLAIAGSLGAKPLLPHSEGTFPTDGPLFIGLLIGVIVILVGLQFMPADLLGPIVEHYLLLAGKTF